MFRVFFGMFRVFQKIIYYLGLCNLILPVSIRIPNLSVANLLAAGDIDANFIDVLDELNPGVFLKQIKNI